jgi:hypothetical protein
MELMKHFCSDIVEYFSYEYLKTPTTDDIFLIQYAHSVLGFPGMFGSMYYIHWA